MLSNQEEGFLKKFIKDNSPLVAGPVPASADVPVGETVNDHLGKLPTTKMAPQDIDDDHDVKMRLRDILHPFEKLGQFYARTGLSRAQVLAMSEKEITRFIATHEANADDVREPTQPSYKNLVAPPPQYSHRGAAVLVG